MEKRVMDENGRTKVKVKYKNMTYMINENEIICIERKNRKLYIRTLEEEFVECCSIKLMLEKLSDNFIQCHQGYIVNKAYVYRINHKDKTIYLKCIDKEIPIGRSKLSCVIELLN